MATTKAVLGAGIGEAEISNRAELYEPNTWAQNLKAFSTIHI